MAVLRVTLVVAVVLTSQALWADLDTSNCDSDVSDYITEIHERFYRSKMKQKDFDFFYKQLVQSPKAETLIKVTESMVSKAKHNKKVLNHRLFVKMVHVLVLGANPMARSYGKEQMDEDINKLKQGTETQKSLLTKYLNSNMGQERMAELLSGDIQEERFNSFKISSNN